MFSGSLVAIVTPMMEGGALDWAAWDRALDFHVGEGSDGIVIAGTTGESPVLSLEEIEELTRRALARCGGKLKVIVGAGTHSTATTVARARALSRLGPDAVMFVTPYYNKPPQEGLYRHFMAAADASAVPVVLYNVPSRTGVDLLPVTVARLARHPQIVALKEATPEMSRARELLEGAVTLDPTQAGAAMWTAMTAASPQLTVPHRTKYTAAIRLMQVAKKFFSPFIW
jgi:4-hydroxy-tetrahydrodipicolinate synthase